MTDAPNYRMPMPAKMGERGNASGGYQRADVRRVDNSPNIKTGLVDQHGKSVDQVTLQPPGTAAPSVVDPPELGGNGFEGETLPANPEDAQSRQTTAPPIEQTTEKPEPVPTSARPPEGGGESDAVPGDADPGPAGGAKRPGYPSMLDEELNHPTGYSGKTAR
jgi:hypothetical protein